MYDHLTLGKKTKKDRLQYKIEYRSILLKLKNAAFTYNKLFGPENSMNILICKCHRSIQMRTSNQQKNSKTKYLRLHKLESKSFYKFKKRENLSAILRKPSSIILLSLGKSTKSVFCVDEADFLMKACKMFESFCKIRQHVNFSERRAQNVAFSRKSYKMLLLRSSRYFDENL